MFALKVLRLIVFGILLLIGFVSLFIFSEMRAGEELCKKICIETPFTGFTVPESVPQWTQDFIEDQAAFPFPAKSREDLHSNAIFVDFNGKVVGYADGRRRTSFTPSTYKYRILLFGNSTLVGFKLPDDWTIASRLQKLINEKYPNTYLIVNYGMDGAQTGHQKNYLQDTLLEANDTVVFFDGAMEAYRLFEAGERIRYDRSPCGLLTKQFPGVALVTLPCFDFIYNPPAYIHEVVDFENKLNEFCARYKSTITETADYLNGRNITFYHIVQPQVWSYRLASAAPRYIDPYSREAVFTAIWPCIQSVSASITNSSDLTHVFQPYSSLYYFDAGHVTPDGAEIVARSIYDVLFPEF